MVVLVVLAAAAVLSAIVKILMTPWPWIALGVYLTYLATRSVLAAIRRRRLSFAVLEVVAAQLDGDVLRLEQCLQRLVPYAEFNAEAAFLLAACHAQQGRLEAAVGALHALETSSDSVASEHGLVLQFPGIPVPLALVELTSIADAARLLCEHLGVLMGKSGEVLVSLRPSASPELAPLVAWIFAEAYVAQSRHRDAAETLGRALDAVSAPPSAWARALRTALARTHEAVGALDNAIREWRRVVADGDQEAGSHLQAALARQAERQREEQLKREADRRAQTELEELRRRAAEATARREAAEREAERAAAREAAEVRRRKEAAQRELDRAAAAERAAREAAQRELDRAAAVEREASEAAQREADAAIRASAKITAAKTAAGRRSALQSGLAEVQSPVLRQQLLATAARAEVDAVLFKASTLKTARAKRRHLEDALTALRADDVPDELQVKEIELLERSLAEIEVSA